MFIQIEICTKTKRHSFVYLKVFGLGNKTYEHYNAVGKYVDKRLAELGGVQVCELGLGDDDGKYV